MSYTVGDKVEVSAQGYKGLNGTVVGYIIELDTTLRDNTGYGAGFNYIVTENLKEKGAKGTSTTGQIESKVSGGKRKSRKVKRTKKHRSTRRHH